MLLIVFSFIFQALFLYLTKNLITNWDFIAVIFIFIHTISVFIIIYMKFDKNRWILISAYSIRIIAMFWDIYAKSIFTLIGSGGDTEGFYRSTVNISNDLTLLKGEIYGGLYSKILGLFSYFIYSNRILLQYINVILGFFVILIIYKILNLLLVDPKVIKKSLIIASFLPISVIHSAILLRESFIAFFVTWSFYFFLKWFMDSKKVYIILSLILIAVASIFHSGVIGIALGYAALILFYSHKKNTFKFNIKTILWFLLFFSLAIIINNQYSDIFLGKFSKVEDVQDIVETASHGSGGAEYLKWLQVTNPLSMMVFSPLKILYFLTSPLPTEWRGRRDILAFLMDGVIYLYFIIFSLKNIRHIVNKTMLIKSILIILFCVVFIFGIGISNAGTAMRHRNKIVSIFIILYALISENKLTLESRRKS